MHPPAVAFGLANASLGLAAVGELAVPALLPASAVLLVVSNASVIREGVRELGRRQLGLPLLYTAIVAGTLGTGQHLAAALMSWMFKFWRHRHRVDQFQLRRQLLPALTQRPRFAQLAAGWRVGPRSHRWATAGRPDRRREERDYSSRRPLAEWSGAGR